MWEGKIRLLKKSIEDCNERVKILSDQVSNQSTDFNNEFAEIREHISGLKNDQKR